MLPLSPQRPLNAPEPPALPAWRDGPPEPCGLRYCMLLGLMMFRSEVDAIIITFREHGITADAQGSGVYTNGYPFLQGACRDAPRGRHHRRVRARRHGDYAAGATTRSW